MRYLALQFVIGVIIRSSLCTHKEIIVHHFHKKNIHHNNLEHAHNSK
jgi:hypothetical protein